jgi:hypothetical protein
MNFNLFFAFLFTLLFLAGCSPEDGFCDDTRYSGGDDFDCSQIDSYFSSTGKSVLELFTSRKAVFSATYLLGKSDVANSESAIIQKPDYMPERIEPIRMSECKTAPAVSGIDCNQWYSFTFLTLENWKIEFSSRDGDHFSNNLALKYCTFEMDDMTFSGTTYENSIELYDTTVIDGASYNISHKYILIDKN